jgi:hypothetical protein
MDSSVKEWVKAARPANGPMVVTVTLVDGNLTAKVAVKAYGNIQQGVREARSAALAALEELRQALGQPGAS